MSNESTFAVTEMFAVTLFWMDLVLQVHIDRIFFEHGSMHFEQKANAYLDAYCNVLSVSWMFDSAADIQASITVRLLPPSESCRKRVSFDSLYGTWVATGVDVKARITFPSDSKPFEQQNIVDRGHRLPQNNEMTWTASPG